MVKTKNLLKTLSACAVVLALGGCGGSDDDGSIVACFTADRTVNFKMTALNVPSGGVPVNRSTVGPMTQGGRDVTGQKFFYTRGSTTYEEANYWTIASNGMTGVARVNADGSVTPSSTFYPQDMSPGQIVNGSNNSRSTFIGFETLSLGGKTFSNTCHFNVVDPQVNTDLWYAPGYAVVKQTYPSGLVVQYDGDL